MFAKVDVNVGVGFVLMADLLLLLLVVMAVVASCLR